MFDKNKKLFSGLERILVREKLSTTTLPTEIMQWKAFIERINNTFYDFEQERYLLERSMEISSKEIMELNEHFEIAQSVAHIGYWFYDPTEKKSLWSKETYRLFGLDAGSMIPKFEEIINLFHEEDRFTLISLSNQALQKGEDFEKELRLHKTTDDKTYWVYIKGRPYKNKSQAHNAMTPYLLSGVIMDITARKLVEQRDTLRHSLMTIFSEKVTLIAAAPSLLELICKTLHLDIGELWAVDNSNETLRCVNTWSRNSQRLQPFIEITEKTTLFPGMELVGKAWQEKKMCWHYMQALLGDTPRDLLANQLKLVDIFALPLLFENKVLGILNFFSDTNYSLDNNMIHFLADMERLIGVFIAREQTQRQVQQLSRQAGMSEIATSVLHNIGNVLNSVNTSLSLLKNLVTSSEIKNLKLLSEMINSHLHDLEVYLVSDEKGKLIPEYLSALAENVIDENKKIETELVSLEISYDHIKDIVLMQRDISGISANLEEIFLPDLMDLAIQMSVSTLEISKIHITKNYEYQKSVLIDKAKVLQVLINLIKNAREAVNENSNTSKKTLTLSIIENQKTDSVDLIIADNGMGITPENVTKIFSMGFTTKVNGHGFGLHSSSIAAKELGGNLTVLSEGEGAIFTFSLPKQTAK